MPEAKRLIGIYRSRGRSSVTSKLSALTDMQRLRSPDAAAFLLQVLADKDEPAQLRLQVIAWLRNGDIQPATRGTVADALLHVLRHDAGGDLRFGAANALAEFADVEGVLPTLGAVALNRDESPDLRYAAFVSLQSAGPGEDCARLLQRLSQDDLLGPSARDVLKLWRM